MNKVIAAALKRKKELQEELRRLDEFISMYKEFFSDEFSIDDSLNGGNVLRLPTRRRKQSIAGVATEIIRGHQRPMDMNTLLEAMDKAGFKVGGRNPAANAASTFSRDPDFYFSRKHGGWWLLSLGNPDNYPAVRESVSPPPSQGAGHAPALVIAATSEN